MKNTFAIGVSYKKADVEIRSKFSLDQEKQIQCYQTARSYAFDNFIILNTCNRTEIYGTGKLQHIENILKEIYGQQKQEFDSYSFTKKGSDALTHIFNVASGLESQILGDFEILGQFKNACKTSKENGLLGPVFERLTNTCIQASKEIKTKTEISKGTTSGSYATIEILKEKIGEENKNCLVVGVGSFGKNISKNIKHYLPNINVTISNRTHSKSVEVADESGFEILEFEKLEEKIKNFDIVILTLNSDKHIVMPNMIDKSKVKLILDLSIPQTIHPDCKLIKDIEFFDINTISSIMDKSLEQRKIHLPIANEIIYNHINSFIEWNAFYKNKDKILNLKNLLIDASNTCPHFLKIDKQIKEQLIQKTVKNFILELKQNPDTEIDINQIIRSFTTT